MLRVMEAGKVGSPPPWPLVKVWLCQFYNCLPSQLANEPADEALQLYVLFNEYEVWKQKRPGFGPSPLKKLR